MSKKANEIRAEKVKIITFWSLIGLATLAFMTVLVVLFIETRPYESYNDIRNDNLTLIRDQMFDQEGYTYFVYVYDSKTTNELSAEKALELEPVVLNYFNFVKQNSRKSGVVKIYGFDVNDFENRSCVKDTNSTTGVSDFDGFSVKANSIPVLLEIVNGSVEYVHSTISQIQEELQSAMDAIITSLCNPMVISSKKDYAF
ncbi:MAG: hypothetical protein WCQ80_02245 [Bacilli bacterium]